MILEKLVLKNYRNYSNLQIEFQEGCNIIYGDNGCGKTNIVEAIYYLANLNSFRISDDKSLIKDNKGSAFIQGKIGGKEYEVVVKNTNKELMINQIPIKKHRDYIGQINVIGFHPEEIYLFKDFPKERRRIIDKEISKIDNKYLLELLMFNKFLKQRNELLKSEDKYKIDLLKIIDKKICKIQSSIIKKRKGFIDLLEIELNEVKDDFDYRYKVRMEYLTFISDYENIESQLIDIYETNLTKDIDRKITGYGVHKDDWQIKVDENLISNYASQGEQRLMILMLKLALVKLLKSKIDLTPIIILDDAFYELDKDKREMLAKVVMQQKQVFITSCDLRDLQDVMKGQTRIYRIVDNQVLKEKRE